jgi:hypothetical protein
MPANHMGVSDGDQHDRLPVQMNAVHMHHMVDLINQRHRRPQLPAPSGTTPERTWIRTGFGLRAFGEQPVKKHCEITAITLILQRSGHPAFR